MRRLTLACIAVCATSACVAAGTDPAPKAEAGLANPASVYCVDQGGTLIPVETSAGTSNDCLLPSGERIDEWELYRRDHKE